MGSDGNSSELPLTFYIYVGKVHLNYSEEEVWRMTPRKIFALWNQHAYFNGWRKKRGKQRVLRIDDIPFL